MKKHLVILAGSLLLLACSEKLYITGDFDQDADFTTYRTYDWAEGQEKPGEGYPMYDNELNRKRIKEAVENEMNTIGLVKTGQDPDILIDFHISIDQTTDYMVHADHPLRYRYWPDYDVASYTVKKGALVIHLVDTKKEQLVWQGTASKTLADVPPEDVEERINDAVRAIFAQYPFKGNKK